jgi:hypothetical protein
LHTEYVTRPLNVYTVARRSIGVPGITGTHPTAVTMFISCFTLVALRYEPVKRGGRRGKRRFLGRIDTDIFYVHPTNRCTRILRVVLQLVVGYTTGNGTLVMNGMMGLRSWYHHKHRGNSKWYATERKKPSKHRFQQKN